MITLLILFAAGCGQNNCPEGEEQKGDDCLPITTTTTTETATATSTVVTTCPTVTDFTVTDNAAMVLQKNFDITMSEKANVQLDCTLTDSNLVEASSFNERHQLNADSSTDYSLELHGLLGDSTYECAITSDCSSDILYTATVTTDPLPDHAPELTAEVFDPDNSWGSYTLFNQLAGWCKGIQDDQPSYFYIADADGHIRWYYQPPGITNSSAVDLVVTHLGNGEIFWGGASAMQAAPQLVNLSHEVLYTSEYKGSDDHRYHHDILMIESGEILGIVDSEVTNGSTVWGGFAVIQHDPVTSEITWFWESQLGYNQGVLDAGVQNQEMYHANSFALSETGTELFVSLLTDRRIMQLDMATNTIAYTIGIGGDFTLIDLKGNILGDEEWWSGLHSIEINEDRLLLLDNGNGFGHSRVREFQLDPANKIATLVWSWDDEDWYDSTWGDADELPNSNVYVTIGNAECDNHTQAFIEVGRESKQVISRIDVVDPIYSGYRSDRLDGCEIFANARYCDTLR